MRGMRMLRLMAGDVKDREQLALERIERRTRRDFVAMMRMQEFVDKIQRRERGDPDLPPMPLDFAEIEKRRREAK